MVPVVMAPDDAVDRGKGVDDAALEENGGDVLFGCDSPSVRCDAVGDGRGEVWVIFADATWFQRLGTRAERFRGVERGRGRLKQKSKGHLR